MTSQLDYRATAKQKAYIRRLAQQHGLPVPDFDEHYDRADASEEIDFLLNYAAPIKTYKGTIPPKKWRRTRSRRSLR